MSRMVRAVLGGALVAALLGSGLAAAEGEPSRAEYVSRLEAICKPDSLATSKAVQGLKSDIRAERLALASTKFAAAAKIFAGTVAKIAPVPRPGADAAKLAKWFGRLEEEERNLRKVAADLRAGQVHRSQHDTALFVHTGNLANDTVLAFGFDYCAFKISRFS